MIYAYWVFAFLVGIIFFKKDILAFNREVIRLGNLYDIAQHLEDLKERY